MCVTEWCVCDRVVCVCVCVCVTEWCVYIYMCVCVCVFSRKWFILHVPDLTGMADVCSDAVHNSLDASHCYHGKEGGQRDRTQFL